jgi:hypothetical protein
MNTLAQYMPALREASGRYYLPARVTVSVIVSAALLVVGLTAAFRYPVYKTQQAIAQLASYNALITEANASTQTALGRLDGLLATQPEWVQSSTRRTADKLREQLAGAVPVDPAKVLADAEAQQRAYDEAQAIIAASPFKGLEKRQIPLTPAGKAYLAALDVKAPARFEYQRLADGVALLLKVYRTAATVQNEAEMLAHRLDAKVNGAAAAGPAPEPMEAAPEVDRKRERPVLDSILNGGEASEPAPKRMGLSPLVPLGAKPAGNGDAERQREAERQRRAELREQEAARKAKAEAEAAELEAAAAAAREQEAAAAAVAAKKQECTRNLLTRAKCAREGYNPVTGEKRK